MPLMETFEEVEEVVRDKLKKVLDGWPSSCEGRAHYDFLIPPLLGHRPRAFRPAVKCGLRWPLGKDFMAGRFNIVEVWHAKYKAFRAPSTRLKLRHEDRFDYGTSTGEVNNEVTLKLLEISQKLRDADLDRESLMEMVERWDARLMRLLLIRNNEAR